MAEMMLRRTRADQVRPVYERFTRRFDNPQEAARLSAAAVEKMLTPLGLRWRAREMHKTIHYLKDNYALRQLTSADDLRAIPGVGGYSDAMLRNRLFDERVAPIDVNFIRLFSRLRNLPYDDRGRRDPRINELCNRFVNSKHSKELNLAILDLGALVCRPLKADCGECPLRSHCETGKKS